jgi:probable HAF family extracellular repeat protein
MTDLGTVKGDPCSEAHGINAKAQVVGGSSDCTTFLHAFLWENGGPAIDLNTLVAAGADLTMTIAGYINDRGEIAGAGFPTGCSAQDGDLCSHAYVLIPCDENHRDVENCDFSETSPAVPNPSSRTLPQSLMRRMNRYHFPGLAAPGAKN